MGYQFLKAKINKLFMRSIFVVILLCLAILSKGESPTDTTGFSKTLDTVMWCYQFSTDTSKKVSFSSDGILSIENQNYDLFSTDSSDAKDLKDVCESVIEFDRPFALIKTNEGTYSAILVQNTSSQKVIAEFETLSSARKFYKALKKIKSQMNPPSS